MSQAFEGIHSRAHGWSMSLRRRSSLVPMVLLMALALIMIAAPVCVLLGEKEIAVSPLLWKAAVDLCRAVTGLFGLLTIASVVIGRRSGSNGDGTFSALAGGVLFIAAAVAGLGLVIVVTGLGGFGLMYAGGALALDAFRSSGPEPGRAPQRG